MSGVCRQWTENFDTSFDRGLTARPVVLAKTYEPGASRSRREVVFRARRSVINVLRSQSMIALVDQAMPAALARVRRREVESVSMRFRPAALAR
jgi:hypothetical protein